ncbi:MAG: hypothetical protein ABSG84_13315 [Acidobacteriaceae bacterium]|jgi:hypothetical protein
MFINTPMWQIILAALLLSVPFFAIAQFKGSKLTDPLARECERFRFRMIGLGVVLLVLLFALPVTAVLGTFGYPTSLEPHSLLQQLQESNRALVRTTEVLYWLIFLLIWWLIASLFRFSKELGSTRELTTDTVTTER